MRSSYLVCYDISDDKRLRKVFKTMRAWGDHIQFSVFECQLTSADLVPTSGRSFQYHSPRRRPGFVRAPGTDGGTRRDRVITALGKCRTCLRMDAPCIVVLRTYGYPTLGIPRQDDLPDYLPARIVNEFVYCPRLFFYEWVEGVFRESATIPLTALSNIGGWIKKVANCLPPRNRPRI